MKDSRVTFLALALALSLPACSAPPSTLDATVGVAPDRAVVVGSSSDATIADATTSDASALADVASADIFPDDRGIGDVPLGPVVTHPDNILNNGGFEYGLQCFGNWVWSHSGVDYRGDYKFFLSDVAHSGAHSVEIRCTGGDCFKAAVISQPIAMRAGQAYTLRLYTRCAAGQRAGLYIPGTVPADLVQSLACTGAWAENTATFQTAPTNGEFHFSIYNYGGPSLLVDDVALTLVDGTVPAHTVAHPGVRAARVVSGHLEIDAAPYLALGFFDVPYAALPQAAAAGANTVVGLAVAVEDCFNTDRPDTYADRALALGINLVPSSTATARMGSVPVMAEVAQRFAPHLANIAWSLVDEPDQADVPWYFLPASTFLAEAAAARSRSPLPFIANLQRASWSTPDQVAPYAPGLDLWMAEPYGASFARVAHATDALRAATPLPTWLAQDAVDASLVVAKAWYAITQGATGIVYFDWAAFQANPAKLAAATQAFTEIGGLREALVAEAPVGAVTSTAGLAVIAREHGGNTWVIAVNPGTSPVAGHVAVAGLAAGRTVTVMFEGRTITSAGGGLDDAFAATTRHVYRID